MTGNELITNLSNRVEDTDQDNFTSAQYLQALNDAQRVVVTDAPAYLLSGLETVTTGVNTQGIASRPGWTGVSFDNAGIVPFSGRITRVYDSTNKHFCYIEDAEGALDNTYLLGTSSDPVAYISARNIYLHSAKSTAIDIYYIARPNELAADDTECQLDEALQTPLLSYAEAALFRMDNKNDRAAAADANARVIMGGLIGAK